MKSQGNSQCKIEKPAKKMKEATDDETEADGEEEAKEMRTHMHRAVAAAVSSS
jgi:hypothetical protein